MQNDTSVPGTGLNTIHSVLVKAPAGTGFSIAFGSGFVALFLFPHPAIATAIIKTRENCFIR